MCLAQGHNAVAPVRLEPTDTRSRVKHYHDSKSQSLNPENKLSYEMKKIPAAIFSQKRLAKCVNGKAVEETLRQLLQNVWCLLYIQILCTVTPQKFDLRLLEILANSKLIWDTLNSEYRTYLWSILITFSNNICFGCVKETSPFLYAPKTYIW